MIPSYAYSISTVSKTAVVRGLASKKCINPVLLALKAVESPKKGSDARGPEAVATKAYWQVHVTVHNKF